MNPLTVRFKKYLWSLLFCLRGHKSFPIQYLGKEKVPYININDIGNVFLHSINADGQIIKL